MRRALALAVLLGCGAGAEPFPDECMRTLDGCPVPEPGPEEVIMAIAEVVKGACPTSLVLLDGVPQLHDASECEVTDLPGGDWLADCVHDQDWWCRSRVTVGLGTTGASDVRTCDGFVTRECRWSAAD
jgi:hypothetical protein